MGGHAFPQLSCPRIPRELYLKVRDQTSSALHKIFKHVAVPHEMPSKADYGDVDFLVSGFFQSVPATKLNWPAMVSKISETFNTTHCRHGYLSTDVIFSAVQAPGDENKFWVQIDVKVLELADEQTFKWNLFQLNYASAIKMIGSLIKPLGLTINPEGLHVRVEEMEQTNFPGSMVLVSKEPRDVLKVVGLDRRILHAGFTKNEEIYEYFASSKVFNPAHFAARLEDEKYADHLEERSAPWVYFITEWIKHYPHYHSLDQEAPLQEWYKCNRAALREEIFAFFPSITTEYYAKRGLHLKEVEEKRLRGLLMNIIPTTRDGWRDDIPLPRIIFKPTVPETPPTNPKVPTDRPISMSLINKYIETPPTSPLILPFSPSSVDTEPPAFSKNPLDTPLYLNPLPRTPPIAFIPHPPSSTMSLEAKLFCIARWTHFDSETAIPYLGREPREKKFEMSWADSGTNDDELVAWVRKMWWGIWMRQTLVNYVGMWKRRFEKEDAKKLESQMREMVSVDAGVTEGMVEIGMVDVERTMRPEKDEGIIVNGVYVPDAEQRTAQDEERREELLARLAAL